MPGDSSRFRRIAVNLPPQLVVALDDATPVGTSRSALIAEAILGLLRERGVAADVPAGMYRIHVAHRGEPDCGGDRCAKRCWSGPP